MPSRCFVAVDLPPKGLALLSDARAAFLDAAPEWAGEKWVRPELIHLTLRFIGPLPDGAVAEALRVLGAACAARTPFELELAGIRAAPSARRATMLWATFGGEVGACRDLAGAMDAALERELDVAAPDRAFKPHVTLVRARGHRRVGADAIAAAQERFDAGKAADRSVSVRSVTLYSSTLGPGGPVYETLGSMPLDGRGADVRLD